MNAVALYPSKPGLSKFETEQVRDHGPNPTWFEPWATHVVLFPGVVSEPFGIIHSHGDQSDVSTWPDQDGLNRGLDALWRSHSECDECQGVLYFASDEPTHLQIVIEQDDEEDLSDEGEADQ